MSPYVVVLVLAGGASRRFGSDKLGADVAGATLLDRALSGVPAELEVVVVGPERPVERAVQFVREEPPGGGPGAALVRGLREALALGADAVVTLPGDAPDAGSAVPLLLGRLGASVSAVVGVDPDGRDQPLQVALDATAARALVRAAGTGAGAGESVRTMLSALDLVRVPLAIDAAYDVDTPTQLAAWLARRAPPAPHPPH